MDHTRIMLLYDGSDLNKIPIGCRTTSVALGCITESCCYMFDCVLCVLLFVLYFEVSEVHYILC